MEELNFEEIKNKALEFKIILFEGTGVKLKNSRLFPHALDLIQDICIDRIKYRM